VIAVKYLLIVSAANLLTFGAYKLFKRISILRFLPGMKLRSDLKPAGRNVEKGEVLVSPPSGSKYMDFFIWNGRPG
jgi:hypothetical protein